MSKIIVSSAGVLLLIILGIYFTNRNNVSDLNVQKEKLEGDLAVAQKKLEKEKEKLENVKIGFRDSFTLAVGMQDQMKRTANIVRQTDFLFTDPNGLNPILKFTNPFPSISINAQRKNVNSIILEWQSKLDIFSVRKIDIKESEKIKKEIEVIRKFIQDLSRIINQLTPINSGLTQDDIDTYVIYLPSFVDIDQVLMSVNFSIQNANINISQNPTSENGEAGTGTPTDYSFDPYIPVVTPEDVAEEEGLVAEAEAEVALIQEQLDQLEEQIEEEEGYTPPPEETPPATVPPPATPPVVPPPTQPSGGGYINTNRIFVPAQGITIQPGPPQLIQGVDDF